jgi:hypothetical protein
MTWYFILPNLVFGRFENEHQETNESVVINRSALNHLEMEKQIIS